MDVNSVLAAVGRMFPSVNLNGAVQRAQEAINGTADSLDGVSATARKLGITPQAVNELYHKYGGTMQGRAICGLLGTTPEALRDDAARMLGGGQIPLPPTGGLRSAGTTKFPRLK